MARDSQNIDKWYKEWLKGLTNPTGARGWQPDEAAQDWVNNAIEKIFGKGSARQTAYTIGNRGMTLPPATGGYQTNPLGNALVASPWSSSMQPGAAGSWIPTAPQPGINSGGFMYELQPVGSWEPQAETGDYFKKDDVLYANEPLRRDWSTNLYYGENSGQLYGQRWNQDKGVYDYTYTGTERNKYGQPAGTSTFAKNASGGPKSARSSAKSIIGTRPAPSLEELQSEVDKLQNSLNNYQFKPRKDFSFKGGAGSQKRYNNLKRRLGILKNTLKQSGWQPGVGTESAASGTGTGWSW